MMSDSPIPETFNPRLVSAGNRQWTPHTYSHAEEVPFTDYRGKPDGSVLAFIYRCDITGALRRWGNFEEKIVDGKDHNHD